MTELVNTSILDAVLGEPDDLGYYGRRSTPNGRSEIGIVPLTFGRARLVIIAHGHPIDGW
jgi:hypothetical protein